MFEKSVRERGESERGISKKGCGTIQFSRIAIAKCCVDAEQGCQIECNYAF